MTPESITFLDANRYHYNWLINAGMVKHLDGYTRERLLQVIRIEFDPGYIADLWCPTCVATLLTYAYVQYDKWLKQEREAEKNISASA